MTPRFQWLGWLALCGLLGCREGCGQLRFDGRGPDSPGESLASPAEPDIIEGEDWSLPAWVTPAANSGLFSGEADAGLGISLRSFEVTWRQLNPQEGVYSQTLGGNAEGNTMASYQNQLARGGPFWMRIWASGTDWAPQWVIDKCAVSSIGTDYNGQAHLPLWNPCLWGELLKLYRQIFVQWGLRSNPDLRLLWVPGGFAWGEFDFDLVTQAAQNHGLELSEFSAWFQQAMTDLVSILNGENQDPADDHANKLVYTGRDYPAGPWGAEDDGFAKNAVDQGLGIRISDLELFNFHSNQMPSLGATIAADGHVVLDEAAPVRQGGRLTVGESTCINDCGYSTGDPLYALRMILLKALQLRVQYLYVEPQESYLSEYPVLWTYVRHSLGKTRTDSADAWVALREAEDRYFVGDTSHPWTGRPWVKNLERWLVQRDVSPNALSRRGSEQRTGVLDEDNGASYEGRQTDRAQGSDALCFDLDDGFLFNPEVPVEIKVTYLDRGACSWWLEYAGKGQRQRSNPVTCQDTGQLRTARYRLEGALLDNRLAGSTDFCIHTGEGPDLEVRFVRVVKPNAP